MALSNITASVLDRLRNQAKQTDLPFQLVLQLFAQEEFLRKLSQSKHNEKFVLKGGMFIYTLTAYESRPTRDVDLMVRGLNNDLEALGKVVREICAVDTGNGYIVIEVLKVARIGRRKEYPGAAVSLIARIGKVKVPFSVDIAVDDAVVPAPEKRMIATRLPGFTAPEIYTYSLESVVAEKLDAILERMSGTSRMKDFFDIYYLSETFDFDGAVLKEAIKTTTEHRHRNTPAEAFNDIKDFTGNDYLLRQWSNYEPARQASLGFDAVIRRLIVFLEPVYAAVLRGEIFDRHWDNVQARWQV
ncbi:nucleotidyl transferase AbiEii/AbiGii toxin family protein [Bifidobacterium panos]|uniref:Nucleotidyltransferase n=1 Tax=Bifidobacterium panos TaxID=2675321 RepID=A0ABX1SZR1_9BIFI|nr:nucleotidyl transferase AbiEii/AbiGii toxin family protein [Bifidobacterium sp. DSM 109963]NMN02084.1 nucleotidyltransferase [Bifidobacterium sp. DSM 109963]